MNPNDIFWLASYAHRVVSPIVRSDEELYIDLKFHGKYPGISIWIHNNGGISEYRTSMTSKGQVDDFAALIRAKASVTV